MKKTAAYTLTFASFVVLAYLAVLLTADDPTSLDAVSAPILYSFAAVCGLFAGRHVATLYDPSNR